MTKSKQTKQALFGSLIALILCFSMLLGTTFAWFTDSVSSGVNEIVAGNLDIEVSYKDGNTWKSIQDVDSLFSSDLWEPGHTEYVTLKIENKGTLALNYKVLVTPVSENGGVNVNNRSFKLSDYLVFGTTEPETTGTTYTRDEARAAVGTTTGLNVNNLTKTGTMAGKTATATDVQYLALVVYMPEDVGNEANYKTGTAAPSIELGIKVVATQLGSENDSFGDDYDDEAVDTPFYTAGAYYDYFEAVNETDTAAADGSFTVTKTDANTGVVASASGMAAAGAQVNLLVVKSSEAERNFTITVEDGHELNGYEIKVSGQTDGTLVQGKLYVGTGLVNFKFYHNNVLMTVGTQGDLDDGEYYYNSTEGYVYFASKTFSPFQATYKAPVAAIGTAVYGTLADAIKAAKNGDTVTLLKDTAGNGIVIPSGSNLTVDFNTFTYDIDGTTVGSPNTETNGFQLLKDSTITFKNGKITSNKALILIQNYSNLTLDNMTVSAGAQCSYVVSNNNGNVVIKDTTINAAQGKVAFDVCRYSSYTGPDVTVEGNSVINGKVEISSSGAKEGAIHKLNVTGGTFNGEIYMNGSNPDFVGNITGGTFSSNPSAYVADGYEAMSTGNLYVVSRITYWSDFAAESYATRVDTVNKVVTIDSAEELALFAKEVSSTTNYSGYTVEITSDIDLGGKRWIPINGSGRMNGIIFNGNDHTISNLTVRNNFNGGVGDYGVGFVGNTNGSITWNDLSFDRAQVSFYKNDYYSGNVGGIVMGYTYGTTVFNNVSVTNSSISGYGKIGAILGMGADPGVRVTFNKCVSKNNTIMAVYDMGGLAGLIQRSTTGVDNATVNNCTVENITLKLSSNESYVNLINTPATFRTDDRTGETVSRVLTGHYWVCDEYYYGGYADYYVSYGASSYDPPITEGDYAGNYIANSEICINISNDNP